MAAPHRRAELDWVPLLQGCQLLNTKQQAIQKAKNEIARAMLVLHNLKNTSTPSGHRQIAALIVELGTTREKLDKVEE